MNTAMTALPVINPKSCARSLSLGVGTALSGRRVKAMRIPVKMDRARFVSSATSSSPVTERDSKVEGMNIQDQAPSPQDNANAEAHGSFRPETTTATRLTGSAKLFADASVEESQSCVSTSTSISSGDSSYSSSDSTGMSDTDSSPAGGIDAPGLTGSAKLFADALAEESHSSRSSSPSSSSSSSKRINRLIHERTQKLENWTGDERMQDAVLRMLVDKYKPLRGPVIRSAEEKLKDRPPTIASSDWAGRAAEPLLPSVEGHRPWHTTFTPPSALTPRVKLGSFPPPSSSRKAAAGGEGGGPKQDIAAVRRNATAQRLGRARESMIDYKLGVHPTRSTMEPRRPPPISLKAWSNLIEERIERAKLEGQFKTLKGRGKPIKRESEETNPFIAREEFLMNRIVQRNQAAPAWVELQNEVENAIQTFRAILRQTWTRRAILILTSKHSLTSLSTLTLSDIRALRDPAWVTRESAYHTSALQEVNEVVRRYNGVAPYAVRKAYFGREKELERIYWESGVDVLEGIRERVRRGNIGRRAAGVGESEDGGGEGEGGRGGVYEGENKSRREKRIGIWEIVRTWIARLRAG